MSDETSVNDLEALKTANPKQTEADKEEQRAAEGYARQADQNLTMRLKVYSPARVYFDGPAFSLTAENATGVFDVLPHHHRFISLLLPCDMIIRSVSEGDRRIRISGGLLHVKADKVTVFLDI